MPVLNFVRPIQVLGDVWRGSDPEGAPLDPAWQMRPSNRLVPVWFLIAWLAIGVHFATLPVVDGANDLPGNLGNSTSDYRYNSSQLWTNGIASLVAHTPAHGRSTPRRHPAPSGAAVMATAGAGRSPQSGEDVHPGHTTYWCIRLERQEGAWSGA